jgi:hypothetical protein
MLPDGWVTTSETKFVHTESGVMAHPSPDGREWYIRTPNVMNPLLPRLARTARSLTDAFASKGTAVVIRDQLRWRAIERSEHR